MTEAEWLTSADPAAMLEFVASSACPVAVSSRKVRLFSCATAQAVAVSAEEHARAERWQKAIETDTDSLHNPLAMASRWVAFAQKKGPEVAALLRDIAGSPWRSYAWTDCHDCAPSGHEYQLLDRAWLLWQDGTVPRMAEAVYAERAFERLPILADALEDAGCMVPAMLNHLRGMAPCEWCDGSGRKESISHRGFFAACRDCKGTGAVPAAPPVHVRGCWALDLLLGKE